MKKIILIGGGGHCKSCIDVIEQEKKYKIAGIVDLPEKIGNKILGYTVFASDYDLPELAKNYDYCLITLGQIGTAEKRIKLFELLKNLEMKFPVITSPTAYVSKHAEIEEGTIVMHGAIINAGAKVGKNTIINSKALLEHDSLIEDHCHVSTASVINGGVILRKGSFYGSGSISKQYVEIPENSFIKANSLISN